MTDNPPIPVPNDVPPPSDFTFSFEVLDVYTLETSVVVSYSNQELPIQALVKNSYLGNVLMSPTFAVSFGTLELF